MNSTEILSYLREGNILDDNSLSSVTEYLSKIKNPHHLNDLFNILQLINSEYALNAITLATTLQIPPENLEKLNETLMVMTAKSFYLFNSVTINILGCAVHDTDKLCFVTDEVLEHFPGINISQLTIIFNPEKIDGLAKILAITATDDKHKVIRILISYPFLLNRRHHANLSLILDKILSFPSEKIASLIDAIYVLDVNGVLNLDTLTLLVNTPTRMRTRAEALGLLATNNLYEQGLEVVATKNFSSNHLKLLKTLNDNNLLSSELITIWFKEKPSNNFANLQNACLRKFYKYDLLSAVSATQILKFPRKKLLNFTIYDWSKFILNIPIFLSPFWYSTKLIVNSIEENHYLDNLLILRSLLKLQNKYSIDLSVFLNAQISQISESKSLFVNNQIITQAYTLIAKLESLKLLNFNVLNNIINRQIPYLSNESPEYFKDVLAMVESLVSVSKFELAHAELLFATNAFDNLNLLELIRYFIPEIELNNVTKLNTIDTYLADMPLNIYDHIKVMPELINLINFLRDNDKLNDDIIIGVIRCFAKACTTPSYSSGNIYRILQDLDKTNSFYSSKEFILDLLYSNNIEYLSSNDFKFRLSIFTDSALKRLFSCKSFLLQLKTHTNLDQFLYVIAIMAKSNPVISEFNIMALSNIEINPTFMTLLNILSHSRVLTGRIFYKVVMYHHYFMDENGNPITELNNNLNNLMNITHWYALERILIQDITTDSKKQQIRNYIVDEIIQQEINLNPAESTHTASVHLGTDITFWMLMTKYPNIDFAELQNKLLHDLSIYENSKRLALQNSDYAWKLCVGITGIYKILNLLAESSIKLSPERKVEALKFMRSKELFANPEIQSLERDLTTQEFKSLEESIPRYILLIYHEITTNRVANITYDEAIEAFLLACYESVRGRNLDSRGNDINRSSANINICAGGVANKFCEILKDQSPLILYFYATNLTIIMQLKVRLTSYIREKCAHLIKTSPNEGKLLLQALASDEQAGDILSTNWQECEENIRTSIYDEFKYFFSKQAIKEKIDEFANYALEYIPSVKHASAKKHYSIEFLNWYSDAEYSLSQANDAKRSFGVFAESSSSNDESCNHDDKRHRL